ncbi:DUF2141 domain-containing protein [Flavobacteriaceae bacterium]|jgi:uncharacterized protein (DUF2141 family)|nr:DUF2141 domain-containing protein [Flavobacteriaceae bacterium]|tara:strand:- start:1182 stop:1670 length:489 start_codon:yes stop_codon:yes gene_type:complete
MKNIILIIVLLISPFIIDAQNQIENKESKLFLTNEFILDIEVVEILKPGNLFIAIWNSSVAFNHFNRRDVNAKTNIFIGYKERVGLGIFKKSIILPKGVYLISVYLDSNFNNKLDYNFLGIPKEQYGFSNNEIGNLRRPKFNEASFELINDSSLKIILRSIL